MYRITRHSIFLCILQYRLFCNLLHVYGKHISNDAFSKYSSHHTLMRLKSVNHMLLGLLSLVLLFDNKLALVWYKIHGFLQ